MVGCYDQICSKFVIAREVKLPMRCKNYPLSIEFSVMSVKEIGNRSLIGFVACSFVAVLPTLAQSLDVKKPAPLQSGNNTGTADCFVGAHYWYFIAEPGSFSGTITRLGSPGDAARARLAAGVAFAPKLPGSVLASADKGELTNFNGSVKTRDRVVVMIDPGPAGLTRAACNYELHVSGNVSFDQESSKPGIVGTYMAMNSDYGLTKFLEDGSVICASGLKGKWSLFDADTKAYVVNIGDAHLSLKLVPGRGLVDALNTDIVDFKQMH